MSRTVLTFKLEHTKDAAVASICRKLDIRKIEVPVEDYGQKLGCLAGISGFPKEKSICFITSNRVGGSFLPTTRRAGLRQLC